MTVNCLLIKVIAAESLKPQLAYNVTRQALRDLLSYLLHFRKACRKN